MSKTGSVGTMGVRRYKRYPAYRDSGVEWLGEIPTAWLIKPLKRLVQFRGGGTPSKENMDYWRGNIPWVSPKDMKVPRIFETEDSISLEALHESATKLIPVGAVLIVVRSGILIHTIPVALAGTEVTLNQDLKALIPGREIVPEYLFYLIAGMQKELLLQWKKEGATVESLEMELVANTSTPIPSPSEQRRIATFLDRETLKIDELVAQNESLVELLRGKRAALITQAVTKGLDPNVPLKDSGVEWLGQIPLYWTAGRLKYMLSEPLKYGANEAAELYDPDLPRFVRITDIDENDGLRDGTFKSLPVNIAEEYLLREGDMLLARSGATVGKTFLYRTSWGTCAYAGYLIRARIDIARNYPDYIRYFTASSSYWKWLSSVLIQATIQNVSAERYANLRLPIPSRSEQRAIASFLDKETAQLDALIAKVQDAIARLKELRIALISAAVTGKIDVRKEVP